MCIKRFFKFLFFAIFAFTILSCNSGPVPDKIISVHIAFDKKLQSESKINSIIKTLRNRIDKVAVINRLERVDGKNQIYLEAATHYDSKRITDLMVCPGRLDFYETYRMDSMVDFMTELNTVSKNGNEEQNPLFDLFKSQGHQRGSILFHVSVNDTSKINSLLSLRSADSALPEERRFIKFLWGIKDKNTENLPLYALKLNRRAKPALNGNVVMQSTMGLDQFGKAVIIIQMNEEGTRLWEDLTRKVYQERSQIAMVIDDEVYSAPGVSSGPITEGASEISGDFTVDEAQDLANILNTGVIPKISVLDIHVEKLK